MKWNLLFPSTEETLLKGFPKNIYKLYGQFLTI